MKQSLRSERASVYRAVIDTNLIVSGTVTTNTLPHDLLEAWRNGKFVLVTSSLILQEVEEVLKRPKIQKMANLSNKEISLVIKSFYQAAFVTAGNLMIEAVDTDPDDNMIISCAVEGWATHIVTGDKKHLLPIKNYQGIPIVTAREFLEELNSVFLTAQPILE